MKKILVIEDEHLIRESIVEFLESEGFTCNQASNGREGIIAAKKTHPDIIICDIKMPEMNGHQVLMSLRDDPSIASIPFVFLSAMVDKKDFRTGMSLGADDYLTKPFTNEDLLEAINTRLAKNKEVKDKLSKLTYNIAQSLPHELRTPLISILGYAQLLMDKHKEIYDDQVFEFAQTIHESGLRLHRLIQNFIIYTRLEMHASKGPNAKIDARVKQVSKEFSESVLKRISKKYQRQEDLETDVSNAEIKMSLDDSKTLIEEIVDNAFKFSPAGSKVSVKIQNENGRFNLIVADKGRGMKPDQIDNIGAYIQFERDRFEQQGSGLGLIISKKLTEMHGGNFTINSEYEKETIVIASIPSK
ncbi:MAG TPA: response regulator [Ignavibacteriaceae bacterium]|nr:response regulator [Ignavibacteriaceae bacterium]